MAVQRPLLWLAVVQADPAIVRRVMPDKAITFGRFTEKFVTMTSTHHGVLLHCGIPSRSSGRGGLMTKQRLKPDHIDVRPVSLKEQVQLATAAIGKQSFVDGEVTKMYLPRGGQDDRCRGDDITYLAHQ